MADTEADNNLSSRYISSSVDNASQNKSTEKHAGVASWFGGLGSAYIGALIGSYLFAPGHKKLKKRLADARHLHEHAEKIYSNKVSVEKESAFIKDQAESKTLRGEYEQALAARDAAKTAYKQSFISEWNKAAETLDSTQQIELLRKIQEGKLAYEGKNFAFEDSISAELEHSHMLDSLYAGIQGVLKTEPEIKTAVNEATQSAKDVFKKAAHSVMQIEKTWLQHAKTLAKAEEENVLKVRSVVKKLTSIEAIIARRGVGHAMRRPFMLFKHGSVAISVGIASSAVVAGTLAYLGLRSAPENKDASFAERYSQEQPTEINRNM